MIKTNVSSVLSNEEDNFGRKKDNIIESSYLRCQATAI